MTPFPLFELTEDEVVILRRCIGMDRVHLCSRLSEVFCDGLFGISVYMPLSDKIMVALQRRGSLALYLRERGFVTVDSGNLRDRWIEELFKFNGVEI